MRVDILVDSYKIKEKEAVSSRFIDIASFSGPGTNQIPSEVLTASIFSAAATAFNLAVLILATVSLVGASYNPFLYYRF